MSDAESIAPVNTHNAGAERAPVAGANGVSHGSPVELQFAQPPVPSAEDNDINPRSPKRPRLSADLDDIEVDFEAAAARALAISLGGDQPSTSPTPAVSQSQQNEPNHAPPPQITANTAQSDQQARIANLPALEDIAAQILASLAKLTHLEIGEMLFGPPSKRGQDYRALKAKFEQTKRMYLTNSPFASPAALGFREAEQIDTLRKTNMATFMASIFSGEIGLRIMDINFLDVFVPEGGRLLKAQASIYLELKTQAFMAAKRTAPAMLNQVMLDLFPDDADKQLLAKRPGAKGLAPSELDFLKRLASRRDILYADMRSKNLDALEVRYKWDDFSREVNNYLAKTYDPSGPGHKEKGEQASPVTGQVQLQQDQMEGQFSLVSDHKQSDFPNSAMTSKEPDAEFNMDDFMAQAARAAEIALQGTGHIGYAPVQQSTPTPLHMSQSAPQPPLRVTNYNATETVIQPLPLKTSTPSQQDKQEKQETVVPTQTEFQQYTPAPTEATSVPNGTDVDDGTDGSIPHRSQTAPTQVLYERARLVTTNKASPSPRKPNPPSHRRPWTNDEENALMTGLDQVKGPHWSQILAMYGPGGTVNESLKDRNQVQLKDKARNLKLFFLKAGIEVPYYLQAVTGDLKTRAPAQAEKREARERERINVEEDDTLVQQDDFPIDGVDDLDLPAEFVADHEETRDPVVSVDETADDAEISGKDKVEDGQPDAFDDVEAMIARAAASVTQSLGQS